MTSTVYLIAGFILGLPAGAAGTLVVLVTRHQAGRHRARRAEARVIPTTAQGFSPAAHQRLAMPLSRQFVDGLPQPIPQNAAAVNAGVAARVGAGLPPWVSAETALNPRLADQTVTFTRPGGSGGDTQVFYRVEPEPAAKVNGVPL